MAKRITKIKFLSISRDVKDAVAAKKYDAERLAKKHHVNRETVRRIKQAKTWPGFLKLKAERARRELAPTRLTPQESISRFGNSVVVNPSPLAKPKTVLRYLRSQVPSSDQSKVPPIRKFTRKQQAELDQLKIDLDKEAASLVPQGPVTRSEFNELAAAVQQNNLYIHERLDSQWGAIRGMARNPFIRFFEKLKL